MTVLFVGGPGLHDPCEKELADASSSLNNQEREDLTASAQVSCLQCYTIIIIELHVIPMPHSSGSLLHACSICKCI